MSERSNRIQAAATAGDVRALRNEYQDWLTEEMDKREALKADRDRLRVALIYLADGVSDEVQPHQDSPLGRHLLNARAALRGESIEPAGTLADGHLAPTDLTDGEPT